ncbi:type IV pilus assembly protein PilV [Pseudoduganella lurida]|uniref:Type IV pilus assembly protein PilV n=1 Tax=Pseudoduganella lurida TaxID=1036180 RepID=A0A562REV6_9BURK|nr:prepilin-type N-terminal cleavage/methylation domain-containing protein [Pseudoduganella lurida]TWI67548.1 type IV pilus assembly protein PilV [Pseudoduganella lurida]
MKRRPLRRSSQRGIALLEALIAVVILALGLLGTIGLQARSYAALSDSAMRAEATIAADRLIGIMSNDAVNLAGYQVALDARAPAALAPWAAETTAAMPGARYSVTVVPEAQRTRVAIEIHWQRKQGDADSSHLVTAYIR